MNRPAPKLALSFVIGALAATAQAASIQKTLDVAQGFSFKADATTPAGCIQSLTIGAVTLPADIDTKFPLQPASTAKCVAVMSSFEWSTVATDPLTLGGRVSPANQARLAALPSGSQDVVFQFAVYEHDPVGKKYIASVSSGSVDLQGTVEPGRLIVSTTPAPDPSTPKSYAVTIVAKPRGTAQKLNLSTSAGKVRSKTWGSP